MSSASNIIKPFDFRKAEELPLNIETKLKEVHTLFAQNIISLLRREGIEKIELCSITLQLLKTISPLRERENKIFDLAFELGTNQRGIFQIDREIASHILLHLLGYPEPKISAEKLTEVEQNALNQLLNSILGELKNSWGDDLKIGDKLQDSAKETLPLDEFLISKLSIKITGVSGDINIIYPFSIIKSALHVNLNTEKEQEKIKKLLEYSELDIVYLLGEANLTLAQIIELKTDDIVLLNKDSIIEGKLTIQGENKFTGIPGTFKGRKAVKVISEIS